MFAGNVSEATTLQKMLADLGALPGATVVMDAGIATEANLVWLKLHGHPYVVVSRKQARQFDCDQVIEVQTAGQQAIQVQRVNTVRLAVRAELVEAHSPLDRLRANELKRTVLGTRSASPWQR